MLQKCYAPPHSHTCYYAPRRVEEGPGIRYFEPKSSFLVVNQVFCARRRPKNLSIYRSKLLKLLTVAIYTGLVALRQKNATTRARAGRHGYTASDEVSSLGCNRPRPSPVIRNNNYSSLSSFLISPWPPNPFDGNRRRNLVS